MVGAVFCFTMKLSVKQLLILLAVLSVVSLVPWLGLYEYNTKGEPREAIVSLSMLQSGDWILPRNNGGEIPYKPPFFHWCVAVLSLLKGEVTLFTSRLPSALALIALVLGTFCFYVKRKAGNCAVGESCDNCVAGNSGNTCVTGDTDSTCVAGDLDFEADNRKVAFITSMILLLCMELHRGGGNCRVDMLLAAFSVGAMFQLYRWLKHVRLFNWHLLWAVLFMGLATFTKGPVGTIIPCVAAGGYCLIDALIRMEKGGLGKAWQQIAIMFVAALLSFVLPAIWYYAAWRQGGQEFLDLVYEENVGRMTHTMSYVSHEAPWWFNLVTLSYGFLPFTLVALMACFSTKGHLCVKGCKAMCVKKVTKACKASWLTMSDKTAYSFATALLILVFYCIPQSKRSVYLMPMYPFVAYFIAKLMVWLEDKGKRSILYFTDFLAVLALLLFVVFVIVRTGVLPVDSMFHGRHADENIAMVYALSSISTWWKWLLILLPVGAAAWWFVRGRAIGKACIPAIAICLAVYIAIDGVYKPTVLNVKSVRDIAAQLHEVCPEEKGLMYEYIEDAEQAQGDPIHYFELNFYLGNVIENFRDSSPESGYLLIGNEDMQLRRQDFERQGYVFDSMVYSTSRRVVGQPLEVYHFERK